MLRRLPRLEPATSVDPFWEDLFGDIGRFRWSVVLFLAANVVIGFALRFANLGGESIWYDEACSLRMASEPAADIISGVAFDVGNPPGYFLLLRGWCLVFGFTIESARAFSAACGTATCLATWMLSMSVSWDRRIAGIATMLVTINPAMIFLSREARTFALCATLLTVLAYIAIRLVRRTRMIDWTIFFLCGTSLVFLHYYNLFLMILVSLPVLYGRRRHLTKTFPSFVVVAGAMFIPFALWMPVFIRQLLAWSAPDVPWWKHAVYFPVYVVGGRTFVWKQDGLWLMAVAWAVVAVTILIPIIVGLRRSPKSIGVPLILGVGMPAVAVMMSILKDPMLNSRYLSPVIPCLIVAGTISIWWLAQRVPITGWVAGFTAFAIPIMSLPRLYSETQKDDWRSVAAYIESNGSDQLVAFDADIGVVPFQYYRPDQAVLPLKMDFTPERPSVAMDVYTARLETAGEFWIAVWLANQADDYPPTERWLNQRFDQVDEIDFRGIQLQRWRTR